MPLYSIQNDPFRKNTMTLRSIMKKLSIVFIVALYANIVSAQTENQEADLKAVFLYNFTRYIDWDSSSIKNDLTIGIIGASPVTRSLNEVSRVNSTGNKRIIIKVFSKPDEIQDCEMIFIPKKSPFSLESILAHTNRNVLTVSEEDGFAKKGTVFNFTIVNNKLKFEVNLKELAAKDIRVSSQLLKLAIIVQ
jgi:hypothetical protein